MEYFRHFGVQEFKTTREIQKSQLCLELPFKGIAESPNFRSQLDIWSTLEEYRALRSTLESTLKNFRTLWSTLEHSGTHWFYT